MLILASRNDDHDRIHIKRCISTSTIIQHMMDIFFMKMKKLQKREHELVLSALLKVPDDRRCCRMVGGILAERTT